MKAAPFAIVVTFASAAQAVPAEPTVSASEIFPPSGIAVPANVELRAPSRMRLGRIDGGSYIPLVADRGNDGDLPARFVVEDVEPGSTIVIEASCEGCADVVELRYPVLDDVDDSAPVLDGLTPQIAIGVDGNPDVWGVEICVPLPDPLEPLLYVVRSDAGTAAQTGGGLIDDDGVGRGTSCSMGADEIRVDGTPLYQTLRDEGQDTFCLTVDAIDAAGNIATAGETCLPIEPYEDFGPYDFTRTDCASSGPAPLGMIALLGLLRALRRRR